jgi:hypothetical protein
VAIVTWSVSNPWRSSGAKRLNARCGSSAHARSPPARRPSSSKRTRLARWCRASSVASWAARSGDARAISPSARAAAWRARWSTSSTIH